MAGYSRAYWIGEPGGFEGADGMNPILVEILVGDADRQWWEAAWMRNPEFRAQKCRATGACEARRSQSTVGLMHRVPHAPVQGFEA